MEQNRECRNKSSLQLIFNKDAKGSQWKRDSLSTNDARTIGYPYVKNKQTD